MCRIFVNLSYLTNGLCVEQENIIKSVPMYFLQKAERTKFQNP